MERGQSNTTEAVAAPGRTLSALKGLLRSSLYTNAFYLWLNTATTSVFGLAFWAVIAGLYRPDEVGLGAAAVAAAALLSSLSHLGLGFGLIRFLPEAGERGPLLINVSFTLAVLAAIVSSTAFLIGIPLWSPHLAFLRDNPGYFLAFIVFTAGNALIWIQDQAFIGLRRAKYVFFRNLLYVGLRLVLPFGLVVAGPFGIVAALGVAATATAAAGGPLLRRSLPSYRPAAALSRDVAARLVPYSFGNYISELLLGLPTLLLLLMVVHQLSPEDGGYFYVAWFLGYLLIIGPVSLAFSLMAEGSHSPEGLGRLAVQAMAGATAMAVLGASVVLLTADKVLLVFGADYARHAADLLRLVALAAVPAAMVNLYLSLQRIHKNLRALVIVSGVMAGATLSLSYVLLPRLGLAGAGIGLLAGQGLGMALALLLELRRALKARPGPAYKPLPGEPAEGKPMAPARARVTALLCARNEEANLPHVLPRIPTWVDEVLLVDGYSRDGTIELARRLRPDIRIVYQQGEGKGAAIRYGVQEARGDIIVTLDADGQTDPADIPRFVAALQDGYDFAKGSRFLYGRPTNMPRHRWLGNKLLTLAANLLFGSRYTDICSGYNAFWKGAFLRLDLRQDGFEMEQEMNVQAWRRSLRVVEVPHQDNGRLHGASNVRDIYQGLKDLWIILRERFRG